LKEFVVPYTAPFEGFKLAYDRRGSGPPVVMLHEVCRGDSAAHQTMIRSAVLAWCQRHVETVVDRPNKPLRIPDAGPS
jgi:hypothetical protein